MIAPKRLFRLLLATSGLSWDGLSPHTPRRDMAGYTLRGRIVHEYPSGSLYASQSSSRRTISIQESEAVTVKTIGASFGLQIIPSNGRAASLLRDCLLWRESIREISSCCDHQNLLRPSMCKPHKKSIHILKSITSAQGSSFSTQHLPQSRRFCCLWSWSTHMLLLE
jgi:hypothetical protein